MSLLFNIIMLYNDLFSVVCFQLFSLSCKILIFKVDDNEIIEMDERDLDCNFGFQKIKLKRNLFGLYSLFLVMVVIVKFMFMFYYFVRFMGFEGNNFIFLFNKYRVSLLIILRLMWYLVQILKSVLY